MSPKFLAQDFPYLDNVKLDTRLLGFPASMNPYVDKTSASRADMYSSHFPQALVLDKSEPAGTFAGTELDIGRMEHNTSLRNQDVEILDFFPKYMSSSINRGIGSPMYIVVYRGLEDGKIGYFQIDKFTRGSDGFGYDNKLNNITRFNQKGYVLKKDDVVVTSPSHKGNAYCMGINANVAFMTLSETIEDAMMISQSMADKMASTAIYQMTVNIRQDVRPIRLYGHPHDEIAQFIPNIGESVKDDGTLCAFRPVSAQTCAADLDPESLYKVQPLRDIVYKLPKDAEIIDLDFALSRSSLEGGRCPKVYNQIEQYLRMSEEYHRRIFNIFTECEKNRWPLTESFSTLVASSITRLLALGVKVPGIPVRTGRAEIEGFNGQVVDHIQMVVTYRVRRKVGLGFKLTGRDGAKGVICRICPDEEMPIDAEGFRVDIVIDPASPVKRMNQGQLFEQGLGRISEFVRRKAAAVYDNGSGSSEAAMAILLDWYNDVNPNYNRLVTRTLTTPAERAEHVKLIVNSYIRLWIPPSLNTITHGNIRLWAKKWGVTISPVSFIKEDGKGDKRRHTTLHPIAVGPKYILCLCKIPHATSCGAARVSHQGIPIKPGRDAKYSSTVSLTPVKFGEDEFRVGIMDSPVEEMTRLLNFSNSPTGNQLVIETILTSKFPTRIERFDITDQKLASTNAITGTFHHQTSAIGIETRQTKTTELPPDYVFDDGDILDADGVDMSDIEGGADDDDAIVVTPVETSGSGRRGRKPKSEETDDDNETGDLEVTAKSTPDDTDDSESDSDDSDESEETDDSDSSSDDDSDD